MKHSFVTVLDISTLCDLKMIKMYACIFALVNADDDN